VLLVGHSEVIEWFWTCNASFVLVQIHWEWNAFLIFGADISHSAIVRGWLFVHTFEGPQKWSQS
jgi:hypothetical protein